MALGNTAWQSRFLQVLIHYIVASHLMSRQSVEAIITTPRLELCRKIHIVITGYFAISNGTLEMASRRVEWMPCILALAAYASFYRIQVTIRCVLNY